MRFLPAAACLVVGCSFPSDGVLLQGDPPDAEVVPIDGEVVPPDAEIPDAEPGAPDACSVAPDACDGPDGDACLEGVMVCTADGLGSECNDATDTIVEVCNNLDDDCDGTPDDGFDFDFDEANCGSCGNTCTNAHGTTTCETRVCTPVCTNGSANCNGDVDDGCELQDTNPTCIAASATPDVTVDGDQAGTPVVVTGTTERVLRVHLNEAVSGNVAITASLALVSGVGATYHLSVLCPACGSTPLTDVTDVIGVGRGDIAGDRSFDVFAVITYDGTVPSTTCAQWTLTVTGNSGSANRCGG